jgi:hypothetical protein
MSHIIEPEELMAYLDGELPPGREAEAAAHLQRCEECQNLAADLQGISRKLRAWEVGPHELPRPVVAVQARRPLYKRRWVWGLAAAAIVLVPLVLVKERPMKLADLNGGILGMVPRDMAAEQPGAAQSKAAAQFPTALKTRVSAPMIARTAQLSLTTRDFDLTRAAIDSVVTRHGGHFAELHVSTPPGSGRIFAAAIRIPADQLQAAIDELKKLGRVESEQQNGEEVTAQFFDLEARLNNARNTERRMTDLLAHKTGKLSDVLEVEREIDRVRGEIEQMEAERKSLLTRVDFATLQTTVTEDYKAQLRLAPDSLASRVRNSAVDGVRSMAGSIVGVFLFLLSWSPSVLFWAAVLFFPARYLWRRRRRV